MMYSNENGLDHKVSVYIENLFSGVGGSQQLFDLKEELSINIKEKTIDYQSLGMDDEQAFKEAVISMGDLGGLVDDMRRIGQDTAKQSVYSTMAARISTAGIVAGVLLSLFGLFVSAIIYFQDYSLQDAIGPGIFIVAGGALITYSMLTRESRKKYAMNRTRALFYALSIGLMLFSLFVSLITYFGEGEMYAAIASPMLFFLAGIGLFLYLALTETDRFKNI
ncbi:MAG: permease prefix domain 1-containing protein [Syntrophomonadaceae bacterium]|nr:permease prefix domain 1-containing protein [Syntrophomonadaceae bacterium]